MWKWWATGVREEWLITATDEYGYGLLIAVG